MHHQAQDVCITGVGLVSSIGASTSAHTDLITGVCTPQPRIDTQTFLPYPVHALGEVNWGAQIPKNADQRQMETWQKLGVYASGLALEDAGLKDRPELLNRTDLIVAAGSGERDTSVDCRVLRASQNGSAAPLRANEILPTALRPTLFLAQLSNLLAGNISIVHHVTGSSRTFMGEEAAGLAAVQNAFQRVAAGQSDICLVGGALNAERHDLLLGYELGHNLWPHPYAPIQLRALKGGGFIPGSVGAFLVFESRAHAEARSVQPYAVVSSVRTSRSQRAPDAAAAVQGVIATVSQLVRDSPAGVFSGASGIAPVTAVELAALEHLKHNGSIEFAWAYGDMLGHSVEAHFPVGLALAAIATRNGVISGALCNGHSRSAIPITTRRIVVTSVAHWRGEGVALLDRAQ